MGCAPVVSDISSWSNSYNSNIILQINKLGHAGFWLKSFDMPGVSIEDITVQWQENPIHLPGNVFNYGDTLSVEIFLDENFQVYEQLYNWLREYSNGENYADPIKTTGNLVVLNNTKSGVAASFLLHGLYLKSISNLGYVMAGTQEQVLTVQFSIDKWVPSFT